MHDRSEQGVHARENQRKVMEFDYQTSYGEEKNMANSQSLLLEIIIGSYYSFLT
jgi:hypothetical protein